jgi:hypothetical protein
MSDTPRVEHEDDGSLVPSREQLGDRTLSAMHRLEAALSAAAPTRLRAWRAEVLSALDVLDEATSAEEDHAVKPDSLVSEIARTQPRFRHRVHGIRSQYRHVREEIEALRDELLASTTEPDYADTRQRLAWVLVALRYQQAREADLIHEAIATARDPR